MAQGHSPLTSMEDDEGTNLTAPSVMQASGSAMASPPQPLILASALQRVIESAVSQSLPSLVKAVKEAAKPMPQSKRSGKRHSRIPTSSSFSSVDSPGSSPRKRKRNVKHIDHKVQHGHHSSNKKWKSKHTIDSSSSSTSSQSLSSLDLEEGRDIRGWARGPQGKEGKAFPFGLSATSS